MGKIYLLKLYNTKIKFVAVINSTIFKLIYILSFSVFHKFKLQKKKKNAFPSIDFQFLFFPSHSFKYCSIWHSMLSILNKTDCIIKSFFLQYIFFQNFVSFKPHCFWTYNYFYIQYLSLFFWHYYRLSYFWFMADSHAPSKGLYIFFLILYLLDIISFV